MGSPYSAFCKAVVTSGMTPASECCCNLLRVLLVPVKIDISLDYVLCECAYTEYPMSMYGEPKMPSLELSPSQEITARGAVCLWSINRSLHLNSR